MSPMGIYLFFSPFFFFGKINEKDGGITVGDHQYNNERPPVSDFLVSQLTTFKLMCYNVV